MKESYALSPCCKETQLVVDKFCAVYDTRFFQENTIWTESQPQQADITVSADPESSNSVNVFINLSNGPAITYTLLRGLSRTDSVDNAVSVVVSANNADAKAQGSACITVYRKILL